MSEEIQPGVWVSNCLINNTNNFLYILNTTHKSVTLEETFSPKLWSLDLFHIYSFKKSTNTDRAEKLLETINIQSQDSSVVEPLKHLCNEFNDIFFMDGDVLSVNNFYKQNIPLKDDTPVYIKNYRIPQTQHQEIKSQVQKMLSDGIVRNSFSEYNSPILLVPKKAVDGNKKWRLVVDFRQLNKKVIPDKFPLPRIDEVLDNLGRAKYFTTLDLMSGFHQIPLDEESKKLTAFSCASGHFEYERLPFGLNISPNSFQRMMTLALSGLPPECAFLYIDDIIVIGCSIKHHLSNLRLVFERLRYHNLKLNPAKCNFFKFEVTYLGHHISNKGISPDPSKFSVIKYYPTPSNSDEVRRFIAFCNYYRRFIQNFSDLAIPLNRLLKKNVVFNWSSECQFSFETLKTKLMSPAILKFPDFEKDFILTTDASKLACGAVLLQNYGDIDLPVAYASRTFTKGESNKSVIERELLAIHWAITYFKPYLYGRHFLVRSDHRSLVYLFSLKNPTSKLSRIRLDLEEFNFTVEYIKGSDNVVSDALSRVVIDSDGLKQIYAITRSMSKNIPVVPAQSPSKVKPDHLHVYDAVTNIEAFNLKKLSFTTGLTHKTLRVKVSNKRYNKALTLELDLKLIEKKEQIIYLQLLFDELNKFCLARHINSMSTIELPRFAIAREDLLFTYVDVELFKLIGNKVLKNVIIVIYSRPRILTTNQDIDKILHTYHMTPIGGHLGINRLYRRIKAYYRWPNMKNTIRHFVRNCQQCLENKSFIPASTPVVVTTTPNTAFELVSIDTIGPLPLSENGNRYAVSIQCDLTKFLVLIPVPDKSALTLARAIVQHCFSIFGPFPKIKTDQGTEYKGVFDEICKLFNISHLNSTPYHPQTVGAVERSHRSLNEYLRIYCKDSISDWDSWMYYFCLSFNTVPNEHHGYSPFELVFGKPSTNIVESISSSNIPLYNYDSYANEIRFKIQLAQKLARTATDREKEVRTAANNNNSKFTTLKKGDTVFLRREGGHKLNSVNEGPFFIVNCDISNAIIQNETRTLKVHRSKLIPLSL